MEAFRGHVGNLKKKLRVTVMLAYAGNTFTTTCNTLKFVLSCAHVFFSRICPLTESVENLYMRELRCLHLRPYTHGMR